MCEKEGWRDFTEEEFAGCLLVTGATVREPGVGRDGCPICEYARSVLHRPEDSGHFCMAYERWLAIKRRDMKREQLLEQIEADKRIAFFHDAIKALGTYDVTHLGERSATEEQKRYMVRFDRLARSAGFSSKQIRAADGRPLFHEFYHYWARELGHGK